LFSSVFILRARLANQEKFFSVAENKFIETLCEILAFFVDALPLFFRGKLNGPVKKILDVHNR